MSDFLTWHPSSEKGQKLYEERKYLIDLINRDSYLAIKHLESQWYFGKISELWDDYVFSLCIQPSLDNILSRPKIDDIIDEYSSLDHLLFATYIRREESPVRFRRAFWNVNAYGQRIARKAFGSRKYLSTQLPAKERSFGSIPKIAFVLKGPYKLAHVEFLHSFFEGCSFFSDRVNVSLILIDAPASEVKGLTSVNIVSLAKFKKTSQKLSAYFRYCDENQFDHICWVACVQNISLYMGMQLAPVQSYWSMKYHSIIMPTIQKYAGLGFGGDSFVFDDTTWFRGRAFPELFMSQTNSKNFEKLKSYASIPANSFIVGCFVRAEKLYDKIFWLSLRNILEYRDDIYFVVASQSLPSSLTNFLKTLPKSVLARFRHLGWIDTKKWIYNLDLYYDSSPRGSCNTIFEAIEANVPILMADSSHNRESSALPYLSQTITNVGSNDLQSYGIFSDEKTRLKACFELIDNAKFRSDLAGRQAKLLQHLKGRKPLFAKDYLNYLLGMSMSLRA